MTKYILAGILSICVSLLLSAQEVKLQVEISSDTILMGNYVELKYTLKNASAKFELPDLEGIDILSGPNTSSSMTMINGKVSQQMSYSIYLQPSRAGKLLIGPAYFQLEQGNIESSPVELNVLDNPDNQQQRTRNLKVIEEIFLEGVGDEMKTKRRKVKRFKI